jgi:hypothetical protein
MKNSANYYNKFKRKNNKIENPILINYERDIDKIHKYIKIQRLCYWKTNNKEFNLLGNLPIKTHILIIWHKNKQYKNKE